MFFDLWSSALTSLNSFLKLSTSWTYSSNLLLSIFTAALWSAEWWWCVNYGIELSNRLVAWSAPPALHKSTQVMLALLMGSDFWAACPWYFVVSSPDHIASAGSREVWLLWSTFLSLPLISAGIHAKSDCRTGNYCTTLTTQKMAANFWASLFQCVSVATDHCFKSHCYFCDAET